MNNWFAFGLTIIIALVWLRACDYMAQRGWISSQLSRKIIHIGTGPIFVLCWLLFTNTTASRWMAAIVPALISVQFFLIGVGVVKDEASVKAMSRSGDRREILLGPFFYGIVFVILTLVYWKESPIGIIALMILCGGDGFADIIGKRFGSKYRIPWAKEKSWMGTLAMFIGGVVFSILVISIFLLTGQLSGLWSSYVIKILLISLGATVVESLPMKNIDNLTVPLIAIFLGELLF